MLDIIKEKENVEKVSICEVPENKNAISLYKKMNFIETGKIVDGEIEFVYKY